MADASTGAERVPGPAAGAPAAASAADSPAATSATGTGTSPAGAAAVQTVGIVGAGTMGAGIAQVAATAGCRVILQDISAQQLRQALEGIGRRLRRAAERGRIGAGEAEGILGRIQTTPDLDDLAPADVVIEAAPERMELKREILGRLGEVCRPTAILTTNTSSLSVTALGAASGRPDRFAGLHFFNPAPVMPLIEVILGEGTAPGTVDLLKDLAVRFGKTPVIARDTPGFIVNRVARPFYGEALRLLGENLVDVATTDRLLRSAGFRMGPFELMDLIGIDVNFAVTQSVYEAYFHEPRYRPHPIQRRLVEAGSLGRKTGRGFYVYREGADPEPVVGRAPVQPPATTGTAGTGAAADRETTAVPGAAADTPDAEAAAAPRTAADTGAAAVPGASPNTGAEHPPRRWLITGSGPVADALAARAQAAGVEVERADEVRAPSGPVDLAVDLEPAWGEGRLRRAAELDRVLPPGVPLVVNCWGGSLRELRREDALGPERRLAGCCLWPPLGDEPMAEWMVPAPDAWAATLSAAGAFAAVGLSPAWVGDAPGGVVGRIVSMLVNEAAFAVTEGVAEPEAIDTAMRLGTHYPRGPWAWYAEAAPLVRAVLEGLHRHYREERYRPAPLLAGPSR
ncbi:MAG TPA: 3-hydroxyacyl-CoA dehydrogenase NAD-binding domain-containing protein [Bacillota bacterium]